MQQSVYQFNLFIFVLLILLMPAAGWCDRWDLAQEYAGTYAEQAGKDAETAQALIDRERQELLRELFRVEEAVREEEKKLTERKARFDSLLQEEQDVEAQLRQRESEAEKILEIYLAAQKDVAAMLDASFIAARSETAAHDPGDSTSPSLADVERLVDTLFEEMVRSGKVERYEGSFIGPGGTEVSGEILRLGDINALYRRSDEVGFLKVDRTSGNLLGVPVVSSWFDRDEQGIHNYFAGKTAVLPVDLSRGEALVRYGNDQDWLAWLRSGGVLVWPILLVGLIALLLIIERMIFLLRTKANSEALIAAIEQLAESDRWQECEARCCNQERASVGRVLRAGLRNLGSDREIVESALQEAIMKELPRLERFLSTISVLAAVAPLLGLLGTVSGMINTFQAITIHGTGDPQMLSGGISEALITTQLGLTVAVPVLLLHHLLERKVDAIIGEMEEKSTALTVLMLKNRGIHGGMVDQAA